MTVTVYTRKDWGANPPRKPPSALLDRDIDELVVHYSSMDAERRRDHRDCPTVVRNIQRYHQETKRWNDIAYNWLTCQHGGVFEGRKWNVMSAATYGANGHTQAVCFLGGDVANRDDVTPDGRAALTHVVRDFHQHIGAGKQVGCHRDHVNTTCPGNELTAWVRAEGWRVANPVKKPWPVPVPAWFWDWVRWRRSVFNYPSTAAWRAARPANVPVRIPDWAWVRLAAMSPKA